MTAPAPTTISASIPRSTAGSMPPPVDEPVVGVGVGAAWASVGVAAGAAGVAVAGAGVAVGTTDGAGVAPATCTPWRITFWYGLPFVITGSAWLTNWRSPSKTLPIAT